MLVAIHDDIKNTSIKLNEICLQAFCHSTFTKSNEICLELFATRLLQSRTRFVFKPLLLDFYF